MTIGAAAELAGRIRLGEDSTLELKSIEVDGGCVSSPHCDGLADELAALANARGGTLVLGVDDKTRQVQGIPLADLDTVERWVREIRNDLLKPALDADVFKLELASADGAPTPVLCIDVPRSLFIHDSPGGYFRRIGSAKRKTAPEVLARVFQQRSQSGITRFDQSTVPGTRRDDLHYALTERFLPSDAAPSGDDSVDAGDEVLCKLGILAGAADAATELTLAGPLLCTEEPRRWLRHAYVQAVSYAGERTDAAHQVDASDIGGPLDAQVVEATTALATAS